MADTLERVARDKWISVTMTSLTEPRGRRLQLPRLSVIATKRPRFVTTAKLPGSNSSRQLPHDTAISRNREFPMRAASVQSEPLTACWRRCPSKLGTHFENLRSANIRDVRSSKAMIYVISTDVRQRGRFTWHKNKYFLRGTYTCVVYLMLAVNVVATRTSIQE
jgi:hypothetical protein